MPKVIDKATGKTISRQKYDAEGMETAETIAASSPDWIVQPSGEYPSINAMDRVKKYNIGGVVRNPYVYKKGGKVKK